MMLRWKQFKFAIVTGVTRGWRIFYYHNTDMVVQVVKELDNKRSLLWIENEYMKAWYEETERRIANERKKMAAEGLDYDAEVRKIYIESKEKEQK